MESLKFVHHLMTPVHSHRFAQKTWGFEYWFENNKQYCGKIIQVRKNEWSSFGAFHFHKIKDETFLVLSGTLMLDILVLNDISKSKIASHNELHLKEVADKESFFVNRYYLKEYDFIRLRPGVLHRFSSLKNEAIFTETSTTHMEEDSYRITSPDAADQMLFTVDCTHLSDFPENTEKFSYKYQIKEKENE